MNVGLHVMVIYLSVNLHCECCLCIELVRKSLSTFFFRASCIELWDICVHEQRGCNACGEVIKIIN